MAQKDTFPQLVATADPSGVPAVEEEKTGLPAMTLTREQYVVVTAGGGVIAAVLEIGDSLPDATLGLVTHSCFKLNDGAGLFFPVVATLFDGENVPTSGSATALPVYALIAGGAPTRIGEIRCGTVFDANSDPITPFVLLDDLGGLLGTWAFGRAFGGDSGNGPEFVALRTATVFRTVVADAAGETTIWTPAAGLRFRLLGYTISVCGTLAALGVETIDFLDGTGGAIIASHLAAVGATVSGDSQISAQLGNGILSAVADNELVVDLGTAFTDGGVAINVWGTEE